MLNITIYRKSNKEKSCNKGNDKLQDQIDNINFDINELYNKVNDIFKITDEQDVNIKSLSNSLSKLNKNYYKHETDNSNHKITNYYKIL